MKLIALLSVSASVSAISLNAFTSFLHFKRSTVVDEGKCLIANSELNGWCTEGSKCIQKCWQLNGNRYDCYEFGVDGKCPWGGMWNRSSKEKSKYPAKTCFKANNAKWLCDTTKEECPACWLKNGSKFDCYEPIGGECEWPDMIRTH